MGQGTHSLPNTNSEKNNHLETQISSIVPEQFCEVRFYHRLGTGPVHSKTLDNRANFFKKQKRLQFCLIQFDKNQNNIMFHQL